MKYKSKQIEIEAMQYLREENIFDIQNFVGDKLVYNPCENEYYIKTLQGDMRCNKEDYIIKETNNEFYICKPNMFEKMFEEVV